MSEGLEISLYLLWAFVGIVIFFFLDDRYKFTKQEGSEVIGIFCLSWPVALPIYIVYLIFKLVIWILYKISDYCESISR